MANSLLTGQTVMVTGGAGGIGEAIARSAIAEGARCLITDIQDERGRAVAAALGSAASFAHLDVTNADQFAATVRDWVERTGRIDCLFSNAGVAGVVGPIEDTPIEGWRRTIDVLLTSTFIGVKTVTPYLRAQGAGSIVCTASVASIRGGLGPHVYTAAKHGVWGLVQSVAAEYAAYGLRINCVAPGAVVSALSARIVADDPDDLDSTYRYLADASRSGIPTTAADVADSAIFLASAHAKRVNGACLVIDGGQDVNSNQALGYYGGAADRRSR